MSVCSSKIAALTKLILVLFQMWMNVHSTLITVTPMHNVTTSPDLSLADATTRMATTATAQHASPTVRTFPMFHVQEFFVFIR